MFGSLRSKFVLSHFIVILVAFILTAAIASVPIRRAQEARLRKSLVLSSESVARQLDLSRTLAPASDLAGDANKIEFAQRLIDSERRRSGNCTLILNEDGVVVLDSDSTDSLVNQSEQLLASAIDQLARQIGTNPTPRRVVTRVALVLDTYSISAGKLDD
ncbi:hypothetical protein BH23CHL2_BH23CHL2_09650 [soil metagenome]